MIRPLATINIKDQLIVAELLWSTLIILCIYSSRLIEDLARYLVVITIPYDWCQKMYQFSPHWLQTYLLIFCLYLLIDKLQYQVSIMLSSCIMNTDITGSKYISVFYVLCPDFFFILDCIWSVNVAAEPNVQTFK